MKMTIKDIAKICNVSVSTVSRAINEHSDINEETKQKILSQIKKSGYTPSKNARNLKVAYTNTIAIIIKGISNPFFNPMIKVLENEITKRGYSFLLYKAEDEQNELDVALKLIDEQKLKGIIFLGGFIVHDKKELEKLNVPFVVTTILNKEKNISTSSYIGIDDEKESEKITDYLISLGHKKILLIGGRVDDISISMLRVKGYKNSLKKNNIKDENIMLSSGGAVPYTFFYGYDMASKIIEKKIDFTAVYCISDAIAIGFMKKMCENNLFAPKDYSIVGFDGIDINNYLTPKITTIRQPVEDMAEKSCVELFNMIEKKAKGSVITFTGDLVIGQSTKSI